MAEAAFQGADDCAILYQEHAKKAGIKINVVREPSDGYWSNVWTVKEFCMCYWSGRPTEDLMFSVAYADKAPWNDTKWAHKRFNELLVAAKAEVDQKKRAQMYAEMQEICKDEGRTLVPMFAQILEANSDKIGHLYPEEVMTTGPADGLITPYKGIVNRHPLRGYQLFTGALICGQVVRLRATYLSVSSSLLLAPLKGSLSKSESYASVTDSFSCWFFIYLRILASSKPTVLT